MPTEESVQALVALGFTGLEAEVYAYLLAEAPATGYRVAQSLGRPVANVYKAIEALESRGAIIVDQGETRQSRAVPADELLKRLEREFHSKQVVAKDALAGLKPAPEDERIYQLRTREQVFERCRSMLERASALIVADLFPDPLEILRPGIEAATARGRKAIVKTFQEADIEGATVVLNPRGEELIQRYPGQWLILIIDGKELLIASLAPDRKDVHQAIWTSSVTLAWIVHTSFTAEMMFCSLCNLIVESESLPDVKESVLPFVMPGAVFPTDESGDAVVAMRKFGECFAETLPGYEALMRKFGNQE